MATTATTTTATTTTAVETVEPTANNNNTVPTTAQVSEAKDESKITVGGPEYLPKHVTLLERAFRQDPAIVYMLCNLSEEQRIAYMPEYFTLLFKAAALNDAVFQEIDDWASCAIWMPPRKKVDNWGTFIPSGAYKTLFKLGFKGAKRMLGDFQAAANKAKQKAMRGRKDWFYLFFIGTHEDQRKKGLASKLIRDYQEVARTHEKGPLPIWIEATTEASMRLYSSLGFQLVHEIRMGVGSASPDGRKQPGGPGVPLWMLIWEPSGKKNPAVDEKW